MGKPEMHTMQKLLLASALWISSVVAATLPNGTDDPSMAFVFRLSLDAGGRITALDYVGKHGNDNPVAKKLELLIRSWQFEPGKVNGVPMQTDTTLTVRTVLRKSSSESIELDIIDAHTGAAAERLGQPAYPSQCFSAVIEARLIAIVSVGVNGKATKVEFAGTSPMIDTYRKAFETAIVEASKGDWRFRPESVGGHAIASQVSLPIDFCMSAVSPCARVKDEAVASDGTVLKSVPIALDSQVTLVTPVAGMTLE